MGRTATFSGIYKGFIYCESLEEAQDILNKIHICLCPIILGGGRPSFVPDKYIELNNQKSFKPNHYQMGNDILFDIEIN